MDPNPATLMCEGKTYTCNQVALLGKLTFVDMHMILHIGLMLKLPSSCREVGMHIAIIYAIHQVVLNILLTATIEALRWLPQLMNGDVPGTWLFHSTSISGASEYCKSGQTFPGARVGI